MGNELRATSQADDLAQIERDWIRAQARIDELTEASRRAIQQLVEDIINCADGDDATPDELAEVQAMPNAGRYEIDHLAEAV
jgi:hypothetical protein